MLNPRLNHPIECIHKTSNLNFALGTCIGNRAKSLFYQVLFNKSDRTLFLQFCILKIMLEIMAYSKFINLEF
jgi:hypothetical protein